MSLFRFKIFKNFGQNLPKFLAINHWFLAKIKISFHGLKENTKNPHKYVITFLIGLIPVKIQKSVILSI